MTIVAKWKLLSFKFVERKKKSLLDLSPAVISSLVFHECNVSGEILLIIIYPFF